MMTATVEQPTDPVTWLQHLYTQTLNGWISVFTQDRVTGDRRTAWAPVSDLQQLTGPIHQYAATGCVWFGVATRHQNLGPGRRGGAAECAALPALWVDIDVAGPNHASDQLPPTIDDALQLLNRYPIPPTAIIHTGGGIQAHWQLTDPIPTGPDAEALLARWGATWADHAAACGWHIDNVFNVDRVMRLPGTWNRKNDPVLVTVIEEDWTRRYGADDLDSYTIDPPPPPAVEPTHTRLPYIGPKRPGDAFNAARTGNDILPAAGFGDPEQRSGDTHWCRPGKTRREGHSATVYADGHTTLWSDAIPQRWPAARLRRPYDPFGLYTALFHGGDFRAASTELERQGYGTKAVAHDDLSWAVLADPSAGTPLDEHEASALSAVDKIRNELLDGDEIENLPPPEPLVAGLLDRDSLAVVYGRPGSGKTHLLLDVALHVATGSWWHGSEVHAGHVLYVVAEGARGVGQRQRAWKDINRLYGSLAGLITWCPVPINLLGPDQAQALADIAAERNTVLVVIDTLARSMAGGDENAYKDMSLVIDAAERIRRATGACVTFAHHSGKDQSAGSRGHSSLLGAVTTELEVLNGGDGIITVRTTKQKDHADTAQPQRFTLAPAAGSVALVKYEGRTFLDDEPGLTPKTLETLEVLRSIALPGGISRTIWAESALESGISKATFNRAISKLVDAGLVSTTGREAAARYTPAEQEEQA